MIRTRKITHLSQPAPRALAAPQRSVGGWRRAIQCMDDALQKNSHCDYSEQIEILGRHLFGELWDHHKPSDSNNS